MRRSMVGRWLLVAAGAAAATECPTLIHEDAGVRLAGYVVSRRRDVDVRDAVRRTWCATARRVASDEVSVIVRFFVGLDTVEDGDDAHSSDVTVVDVMDGPSAVPHLRLYALLQYDAWARGATHFLALDDDAYPFLDRITQNIVQKRAMHAPAGRGVGPAISIELEDTFVWGYFMEHPKFGPWPFAAGFGKILTADLAHALAAMNATVPLELGPPCLRVYGDDSDLTCERACDDADPRVQGVCLKRVWIYEDNLLGMLLTPYKYQLVHDKRFHVVPGPPSDRNDGAPGIPPSRTSLLVDRHDFKHAMGVVDFLEAMHAAALTGNYDRFLLSPEGVCGLERLVCFNNSVGEVERVGYEFAVDDRTIQLVFDDCRGAEAFGDVCVANASDTQGRVSLWERADTMHVVALDDCRLALDDCRALAADVAAVGRAALPGSCGG